MKRTILSFVLCLGIVFVAAQEENYNSQLVDGQACTSIMVGKKASADGSVITSHTCDGRYRTWMTMEPARDYKAGSLHIVRKGTMHTMFRDDTTGVTVAGTIPQVAHSYAYLNTAYPCLNEKQLAIGETTFGGPDTLRNPNGMFMIEELERVALMRCDNARDAIRLIGRLIKEYGYGDGGECITIADRKEVWQMEILGEGRDKIGGIWAAQRIPDDHVAVSCNIPHIGKLQRDNSEYFVCSDNIEKVARKYGLWDGKGDFIFWKAFNASYANGKNYRERDFFILSSLAPSLGLSMDMDEMPFSVKPEQPVDVTDVMQLLRSTYEGTDLDMCRNIKTVVSRKQKDGSMVNDTVISPLANPWMGGNMQRTLNLLKPGTVTFRRTVSVAWCSYSFVAQLRDWLPDEVGGICWVSVDNPGQSPRIPIFCGTSRLPRAFDVCGQKKYNEDAILWQYRKANKLATVAWQSTREEMMRQVLDHEQKAFKGLADLERSVKLEKQKESEDYSPKAQIANLLNDYTYKIYDATSYSWRQLEAKYWHKFGMGF
ncbi:MAG: C69 family dipeptidase [Bacteroidales bacterium]|nr:C69 family dipeptidase [Bacteroidales bacterium]